jgi:hypothetical protein
LVGKSGFNGELLHFGSVRMRVTGSGVLRPTLQSLDEVNISTLPNVTMSATTNREPTVLSNFIDQRGQLKLETTAIDETFTVSKITIFIRPVATGYPQ